MNTFNLSLDLDKTPDVPDWVTLRQGDKSGTVIVATIYDHGVQLVGTYTARVVIGNPDGEHYYRANATYNAGVATVTVDEQTAASVAGSTVGYFEILQGSTVIASTANFGVRILESALDGAVPGEVYDSAIQDAIDGLNTAVAELPDTVEDILEDHPEWTTTVQDGSITDAKLIQSGGILSRVERLMLGLNNLLTATPAEADSVSVSDAAKTPLAGLSVYGRSTQSGTPTPSAPVPIVSVAPDSQGNISLWARGRNLLDAVSVFDKSTTTYGGCTITRNGDGTFALSGTNNVGSGWIFHSNRGYARFLAGTYTFSNGGSPLVGCYMGIVTSIGTFNTTYGTVTFTATEPFMVYEWQVSVQASATISGTACPTLTLGSASQQWTPYESVTIPIPLQGHELRSLPDGTRDEVTVDAYGHAVLTQRVGAATLIGAGGQASEFDNVNGFTLYASAAGMGLVGLDPAKAQHANLRCDSLLPVTSNRQATNVMMVYSTGTLIVNIGGSYANTQEAIAAVTALHATVLYPLATPVTIDLGTIDPVALQGPDMTAQSVPTAPFALTYERDLNIIIGGIYAQLAPVDGPTATSNHGVGTYLMLGGTLCRVTTAIAAGETIALGTNVVATNVMTEILALTA